MILVTLETVVCNTGYWERSKSTS